MSELLKDGTLIVNVEDSAKIGRVLIEDEHHFGGLYYADRPEGAWKCDEYTGVYICSNCGCKWELNAGTPEDNDMNYCPECGADMRGDNNERKQVGV